MSAVVERVRGLDDPARPVVMRVLELAVAAVVVGDVRVTSSAIQLHRAVLAHRLTGATVHLFSSTNGAIASARSGSRQQPTAPSMGRESSEQ
jgi:hypothetical protein